MRLYIAAASHPSEHGRVTAAFTAARLLGCDVFDWRIGHKPTAEMTAGERHAAAEADLVAITDAAITWVLAPPVRSDALVEMGIAIGYACAAEGEAQRGPHTIVSGPLSARGIFASLAEEYDTDAEALAAIRRRVEGQ